MDMDILSHPDHNNWLVLVDGVVTTPSASGWYDPRNYRIDTGVEYAYGVTCTVTYVTVDPNLRSALYIVAKAPQGPHSGVTTG
jgi:hypothetical protein